MSKELGDLDIHEGNKLIAEFMGIPKCGRCSGDCGLYKFGSGIYYSPDKMEYRSDWNWIMPVWKKFREINYDYPNGIKRDDLKNEHEHFRELIIGSLEICSIKMAFRYIVDAIKWHNKNK